MSTYLNSLEATTEHHSPGGRQSTDRVVVGVQRRVQLEVVDIPDEDLGVLGAGVELAAVDAEGKHDAGVASQGLHALVVAANVPHLQALGHSRYTL